MRVLVVGAKGTIGRAVVEAFTAKGHEVLRASRSSEYRVDIADGTSIRSLYEKTGKLDAVVSCAGDGRFGPLLRLSDEDFSYTFANKLMGQVNLVRLGVEHMNEGGVFLLTAGIFATRPPAAVSALAMANGALESFARAASQDLPRHLRLNTISPPFLNETAAAMGMPGAGAISAADNAKVYVAAAEGKQTGQVLFS